MGLEPADRDFPENHDPAISDPSTGEWTDDRGQTYGRNQIPAAVPCPSWCDGGCDRYLRTRAGHLVRVHRARVVDDSDSGVEVWLGAVERALAATGPVELDPIEARVRVGIDPASGACVYPDDPPPLTAAQLRATAATLCHAADRLDELLSRRPREGEQPPAGFR